MLDPVVIPLPLALAAIAVVALAAAAARLWLNSAVTWYHWTPGPIPPKVPAAALPLVPLAPVGRHRLDAATEPFRDWAAIATERLNETRRRNLGTPGGTIYRHQPLTDRIEETRDRDGNGMWSWADTHELTPAAR